MSAVISFNGIVCSDIDGISYKINPVGNETGDAIITRSHDDTHDEVSLQELEDDFNIYKPMNVMIEIQNRSYVFDYDEVAKHHCEKERICDQLFKENNERDNDNSGCDAYLFLNSHDMFWKYCALDKFFKMIEKVSTNMYWRTKVEGDCPVTMEKLKVGECCRLPCDHIISSIAFKKIKKGRGGATVCPLCRGYIGHNEIIIK
jgi:hypothetical protein